MIDSVDLNSLLDMFRSIRKSKLGPEIAFPVTVGASSKQTLANWHLLEPADVIQVLGMLNGDATSSNIGAVAVVDGAVPEARI
jgi:trehalose 6-phosphate synthase/phosphatase